MVAEKGAERGASASQLLSLVPSLYGPGFLYAIGQGAVIPVIALAARDLGAPVPLAGVIVGLRGLGTLFGDLPAGAVVARLGDRSAVSVATAVLVIGAIGGASSHSPLALAASVFAVGLGWSVWLLARLNYAADVVPTELRGRAIAALGGANRVGNFVGPLIGAAVVSASGPRGAFWILAGSAAAGAGMLLVSTRRHPLSRHEESRRGEGMIRAARLHHSTLGRAGVAAMAIGALRTSRQVILPLWARHVGIDATGVSLIFAISSALDMTLFLPAGAASDRWGRKLMAISCLSVLAVGHLLIPTAHSFTALAVVAGLLGLGNGLGSGIVMTIGADLSPVVGRAEFLGVWRFVADLGTAGGPFVVAAAAALFSIGPAPLLIGGLGLVAAGFTQARMPEPGRPSRREGPGRS